MNKHAMIFFLLGLPQAAWTAPCATSVFFTGEVVIKKVTAVNTYLSQNDNFVEVRGIGGKIAGVGQPDSLPITVVFKKIKCAGAAAGCSTLARSREAVSLVCENTARNALAMKGVFSVNETNGATVGFSVSGDTTNTATGCIFNARVSGGEFSAPSRCGVEVN